MAELNYKEGDNGLWGYVDSDGNWGHQTPIQ